MRDHIHTVVGRYKGKIKVWDVVNEAVADGGTNLLRNSLWLQIIGPDFIAKAFEYAHEADPDAILRYNDYGLENPAKRRKLITLIKSLQEQHVPVMAIGSQAHVNVSSPSFEEEDQTLTEIETLGLPIHITELDVNSAQGASATPGRTSPITRRRTQGGLVEDADRRLADAYAGSFPGVPQTRQIREAGHVLGRQRRALVALAKASRCCLTATINPSRIRRGHCRGARRPTVTSPSSSRPTRQRHSLQAMKCRFPGSSLILVVSFSRALALDGQVQIHDPSTVIQCDGKYYTFGTGGGGLISDDGWTWSAGPRVPASGVAPDVIHIGDRYYLYYAQRLAGNPEPTST